MTWPPRDPGVLVLPTGRTVRGRGRARGAPAVPPAVAVHLSGARPPPQPWPVRWVRWPDFGLPGDDGDLAGALAEALARAGGERVEVSCRGGLGRTGAALAGLAVLDGVPGAEAVAYVRARYHPRAVETLWQRRYVERFAWALQGRVRLPGTGTTPPDPVTPRVTGGAAPGVPPRHPA